MIKDIRIKKWFYADKNHKKNKIVKILGVEYAHLKLKKADDLYVTADGTSFVENLKPENYWTDKKWFEKNSIKLSGTSSIYKVRTKKVKGRHIDLVIKWNRMGQDIPGVEDREELMSAKFNSPFEEVSLIKELRSAMCNSPEGIFIQKPLAIYTPSKTNELWQTGRKEYKMQSIIDAHKEITLDIARSYAVIYEWIEGIDAAQAFNKGLLDEKGMKALTINAEKIMKKKGFVVRDNKPHHSIVEPKKDGKLKKNKDGKVAQALIDFELLERTHKQEEIIRKTKRREYHKRQKDRFAIKITNKLHPHLTHMNILGVEYIFGHVESTNGRLWVVGKDPYLFDYFLPERWENNERIKISMFSESYCTVTKDNIHIIWEVSKVGLQPDMDPGKKDEKKILEHGYNSPFEEVALALYLKSKGIETIYPRAIYMMGNKTEIYDKFFDKNRYKSHKDYIASDGISILKRDHNYIIIWGDWNGPDEKLAIKDGDYCETINALRAYREKIISQDGYFALLQAAKEKLSKVGIEDLNLRGNHLLISFDNKGNLITDSHGIIEVRLCNFEFLKNTKQGYIK